MTKDPLGIQAGINLYRYAGNDPVNFVDPSGLAQDNPDGTVSTQVGSSGVGTGVAFIIVSLMENEGVKKFFSCIFRSCPKQSPAELDAARVANEQNRLRTIPEANFNEDDRVDGGELARFKDLLRRRAVIAGVQQGTTDKIDASGAQSVGDGAGENKDFGARIEDAKLWVAENHPDVFEGINPTFYSVPFLFGRSGLALPFGVALINNSEGFNADKTQLTNTIIHESRHLQDGYPRSFMMILRGTFHERHKEIFIDAINRSYEY